MYNTHNVLKYFITMEIAVLILITLAFIAFPSGLVWLVWKKTNLSRRKKWFSTTVIIAFFLFILNTQNFQKDNVAENVIEQGSEVAKVSRVIDGDTIELSDGRRVRYIGMDTPEINYNGESSGCFSEEARETNKNLVEGKEIKMEKDISETDKYDRILRYVYIGDVFVNEYLVEQGLAQALYIEPDTKFYDQFKKLETEARENKRGMWKACY